VKKAARPTRLVVPIYNEAGLVDALAVMAKEAATRFPEMKLVFVDDGSRDGSGELLRGAFPATSNVEIQILCRNGGKGRAIRHGFRRAPEERLIFMDGDLAYSLDHIRPLLEALETYDVVIGSRAMALQAQGGLPARRVFLGWGFNRLACFILGLDYPDTQAGTSLPLSQAWFSGGTSPRASFLGTLLQNLPHQIDMQLPHLLF
jgi:dolichyl-phosphate beta-glucosyltransferase